MSFFLAVSFKKMSVGSSNDTYEIEADAMANKEMMMQKYQQQNVFHTATLIQRKCDPVASIFKIEPNWSSDGLDESKSNPFV